mmetsp:Transcript_56507/g.165231  ORF Transcript_56507/g.165231 Transcript_56507/m.165231 type:complete len:138 (+) Transcript_56507:79-492(+)
MYDLESHRSLPRQLQAGFEESSPGRGESDDAEGEPAPEAAPPPGTLEEISLTGSPYWHRGPCQGPRCALCYKYECVKCGARRNGMAAACRVCPAGSRACGAASTCVVGLPSPSRAQLRQFQAAGSLVELPGEALTAP